MLVSFQAALQVSSVVLSLGAACLDIICKIVFIIIMFSL